MMKHFRSLGIWSLMLTILISCNKEEMPDAITSPDQKIQKSGNAELASNDVNLLVNGPNDFTQVPWSVNYVIPSESVPIPGDFTLNTPNPILSEAGKYKDFVTNIPVNITVTDDVGAEWYSVYRYNFKNRSNKTLHLDCAFIVFIAPDGSNMHHGYLNDAEFGHPQQDYVEVPIAGTHNSYYIARLVFHDVPEGARTLYPGQSFQYYIGVPISPYDVPKHITAAQSKVTVRLIADLTGNKNEDLVRKYGTKRYRN